MYLHKIKINNIRSINAFELTFKSTEYAGWHVIIGDNGAGKSTLVRAIALALVGPLEAIALRQTWFEWLRQNKMKGNIELQIAQDSAWDKTIVQSASTRQYIPVSLCFQKQNTNVLLSSKNDDEIDPNHSLWGKGTGWFSASYGPFRRFTGGDRAFEKLFQSNPRLAPHLSVFGENVALTECLDWLQELHIKQLEGQTAGKMLTYLKKFINEGGLLPYGTIIDKITSDAIVFRDGNGCVIAAPELSDGYRSILSITFDLIHQMVRIYGANAVFKPIQKGELKIDLPGIVLIDEIDAHLHPSWQQQIGHWFCRYFPNIQFIVTTHSPLVCQAAERGTVWRLPTPGSDLEGGRVEGIELQRLVYGNILEALDSNLFGFEITRSNSSKDKLQRLAFLNHKALRTKLSQIEEQEQQQLRAVLPTAVNITMENNVDQVRK